MSYPSTSINYEGDGSTLQFSFPFAYRQEDDVRVLVDGEAAAFTINSPGLLELAEAPDDGALIRIYRDTDIDEAQYVFDDGVPFLLRFADANWEQAVFKLQELATESAQLNATTLRVPETNVAILPPATERAGKVLGFNTAGNPVALEIAPSSIPDVDLRLQEVEEQVAANTPSVRGVATVADLNLSESLQDGQLLELGEFSAGTGVGGGGLIVTRDTLTPDDGEIFTTGTPGQYARRRRTRILNVWDFGANPGGLLDSTAAFQKAQDYSNRYGGCAIYIPEGTYLLSGSGVSTEPSNSYYRMSDFATYWFGAGTGTILTRNDDQAGDVIDFSDPSDFHNSIFNVHSGNNIFENFQIRDAKSGIYLGQIDGEVDTCHGSMNRFSKIWINNSGVGIHMRSGVGNYYNAFNDIHIWQCQVGEYIAKHPDSLISAANNNRNSWKHVRNARCHVGLWIKDGDTNQFIGQHNEGNSLTPSNNRYAVPSGLPYGLTGGIGQLLETNGINNQFVACMQEGCEVELINGGERNSFSGLYRDETAGKVRHIVKPYFYSTRTMSVTNSGTTYYFTNPQTDIFAGKQAGVIHNEAQTRNVIGPRLDVSSTEYVTSAGYDLGAVASGGTADFTLWAENTAESASSAYFEVELVGNSQAGSLCHATRFRVLALRNGSRVLTRYYVYDVSQARATGTNAGDLTEPFTPTLSLSGNNLILTVTAPARTFASVIAVVRMVYTK